ncbi:hypothetical protein [Pseudanabaena sp. FACHB-2040]|uniref:hypothetical protein n=1 Tax=Pseudanabaena sp. FACHB-2040 TaxID=2692859 RepID=UPI0016898C5B|nr:hypothetical protein [Pseudanabaena sp. FACHB-2040]MBD2261355.1 hypothetical protein [Pseudanabaena sp. FACHB-2040]
MQRRTSQKTQGKKASQAVINKGFKLFCQQQTLAAIAKATGYSSETVSKWAKGKSQTNPSGDRSGPWKERRMELLLKAQTTPPAAAALAVAPAAPRQQAERVVLEVASEVASSNVVDFGARRDRKSILEDCKTIRQELRRAVERLVEHDDFRPLGSCATAFERIARLEIELDPATPMEWVRTAVERGWSVPDLADAIVAERRVS